jgi:crotonobetainyl-CoA hydratase
VADAEDVVLQRVEDRILVITLNRPEARNAVDARVSAALAATLDRADGDRDIWAVVVTGAGDRAFSAGADLKAVARGEIVHAEGRAELGFAGFVRHPIRKPVVAAVNGVAVGGGLEIVLHCDLAVAAESAVFGFPEVKVGKMAAAGGAFRIARQIPAKIASELLLTGAPITAARAAELGLVNRVVPDGTALDGALELARTITANAPLSVQASKRVLLGLDPEGVPREADDWERLIAVDAELLRSKDSEEGVRAFVEKRTPTWTAS